MNEDDFESLEVIAEALGRLAEGNVCGLPDSRFLMAEALRIIDVRLRALEARRPTRCPCMPDQ